MDKEKNIADTKPYHIMGCMMNDYHIQYRRKQIEEYHRELFRTDREAWRRIMRNKLSKHRR